MAKKKPKFYVVWKGKKPGIYTTWSEAQAQISGFAGALYKSYGSRAEAESAFRQKPHLALAKGKKTSSGSSSGSRRGPKLPSSKTIIGDSLSVDAACSGNPGPMEYQGVRTDSGERIFHQAFPLGTNNIGEFLALVHGLALLQKQGLHRVPIYTDSKIAYGWVKKGKAKSTLPHNATTASLYAMIERAENWLAENDYQNPILKWKTEVWGEIPADFGRK
jgi:ribonuclease HI